MKKLITSALVFAGLGYAANFAYAQPPIMECPKYYQPATADLTVSLSTNLNGCPLLENKYLYGLVKKSAAIGTVFAYPSLPCLSGTNLSGTINLSGKSYSVHGYSESAQLISPEYVAIDPVSAGVFLTGISGTGKSFVLGAAMSVANIIEDSNKFTLKLVSKDSFIIDSAAATDTEMFELVAADGHSVVGRLTGVAQITGPLSEPLNDVSMNITGPFCLRW